MLQNKELKLTKHGHIGASQLQSPADLGGTWMAAFRLSKAVALAFGSLWLLLLCIPTADISRAVTLRIRAGMTPSEVEALVGGRPGVYDGVVSTNLPHEYTWQKAGMVPQYRTWTGPEGTVVVGFDVLPNLALGRVLVARFDEGGVGRWSVIQFLSDRLLGRLTRAFCHGAFSVFGFLDLPSEVVRRARLGEVGGRSQLMRIVRPQDEYDDYT